MEKEGEERRDGRAKGKEATESDISKRGQQTDWTERKTDITQEAQNKIGWRGKRSQRGKG